MRNSGTIRKKKQTNKTKKTKLGAFSKIVQKLTWSSTVETYQPDLLTTNRTLIALGLDHVYDSYKFIIKFRYNARSDWLKECALSEYRARPVEQWRTNSCFGILTNLTEIKRPLWFRQTKKINMDYMEAIVNNSSVKTVRNLQVMPSFRQTADENTVIK